jgi:hypothetical protein
MLLKIQERSKPGRLAWSANLSGGVERASRPLLPAALERFNNAPHRSTAGVLAGAF